MSDIVIGNHKLPDQGAFTAEVVFIEQLNIPEHLAEHKPKLIDMIENGEAFLFGAIVNVYDGNELAGSVRLKDCVFPNIENFLDSNVLERALEKANERAEAKTGKRATDYRTPDEIRAEGVALARQGQGPEGPKQLAAAEAALLKAIEIYGERELNDDLGIIPCSKILAALRNALNRLA